MKSLTGSGSIWTKDRIAMIASHRSLLRLVPYPGPQLSRQWGDLGTGGLVTSDPVCCLRIGVFGDPMIGAPRHVLQGLKVTTEGLT